MKHYLLIFSSFFICFSLHTSAQNLVQNPDFELTTKMPSKKRGGIDCAKNWQYATFAYPEYYHMDAGKHFGTRKNVNGKQAPHSGKAYAGLCISKDYIDYLSAKLTDTLIKGQDYLVEFYVSKAEKSRSSVKEFGILFTNKIRLRMDAKGIAQKPSVDFLNKKGFKSKKHWIKLSAVYRAEGVETVLILGYFTNDHPEGHKRFCHYYIDDLSVTPIKKENDSTEKTEMKELISIEKIEKKDSMPQSFSPKLGETITLKNVFFTSNESTILSESFPELDKLVQYLNKDLHTTIEISGHTDNTGNENQNKMLSEARSKAIADYLVLKGIHKSRIASAGYGSSKPIATNGTEEGKQQNRRVEFTINKK